MGSGPPRVALFDLGGVLFRYSPEIRWQGFAELTGLEPSELEKRLAGSGYSRACDLGRLRGDRAWQEGQRLLGQRLSRERFVQIWVSAFRPDQEVLALAGQVKEQAAVALLTNNSDLVREGLELCWPEALAPFMPRIFSSDLGLTKPDPRLFHQAASLLGAAVGEILLVDDSPANTDAAAALGFRVHRYRDPPALRLCVTDEGLL
jgi:putative hydrolase of the HAD superfamily